MNRNDCDQASLFASLSTAVLRLFFSCLIPMSEHVEQMDLHWQHWSINTVSLQVLTGCLWLLVRNSLLDWIIVSRALELHAN